MVKWDRDTIGIVGVIVVLCLLQLPLWPSGISIWAFIVAGLLITGFLWQRSRRQRLNDYYRQNPAAWRQERTSRIVMIVGYTLLLVAAFGPTLLIPIIGDSRWLWIADVACLVLGIVVLTWRAIDVAVREWRSRR